MILLAKNTVRVSAIVVSQHAHATSHGMPNACARICVNGTDKYEIVHVGLTRTRLVCKPSILVSKLMTIPVPTAQPKVEGE